MFDATHVFDADLNCLDCGQAWPCPGYQELVCAVFDDDLDAVARFMRMFVPAATRALRGLNQSAVQQRVVDWCERRRPQPAGQPQSASSGRGAAVPAARGEASLAGAKGSRHMTRAP